MSGTFGTQETPQADQQTLATEEAWWQLADQLSWYGGTLLCAAILVAVGAVASKGVRAESRSAFLADIGKISLWASYTVVIFQTCVTGAWVTLAALERSLISGSTDEAATVVITAIATYFGIGLSVETSAARAVAEAKRAEEGQAEEGQAAQK